MVVYFSIYLGMTILLFFRWKLLFPAALVLWREFSEVPVIGAVLADVFVKTLVGRLDVAMEAWWEIRKILW